MSDIEIENNSTVDNNTNETTNINSNPIDVTINLGPFSGRNNNNNDDDMTHGYRSSRQNNNNFMNPEGRFGNLSNNLVNNNPNLDDSRYRQNRNDMEDNSGFRVQYNKQPVMLDNTFHDVNRFGGIDTSSRFGNMEQLVSKQPYENRNINYGNDNRFGTNLQELVGKPTYENINVNENESKIENNLDNDVPIYNKNMNLSSVETCFHLSQIGGSKIQESMTRILGNIIRFKELKIDYNVNKNNKYEIFGRVFTSQETQYVINIYKLGKKDNNNNISIIEIKNIFGGEGFGFDNFENLLVEKLKNEKIIIENKNDNISDFGMSILDSLTLDEDEDEMEDDDPFQDLDDEDNNNNNNDNDNQENDKEFDFNLCEIMLETLYNKNSFREEYMHDAYQLASYLSKNDNRSKNMFDYILKNDSQTIIEKLLEPIKSSNLYCAFIILYVLEIIYTLVSKKNIKSKLKFPKTFSSDVTNIFKMWSKEKEDQHNNLIGNIKLNVAKSQQISNKCQEILDIEI